MRSATLLLLLLAATGCTAPAKRLAHEPVRALAVDARGAVIWFDPGVLGAEILAGDPAVARETIRSLLGDSRARSDGLAVADYATLLAARLYGEQPDLALGPPLEVRALVWRRWADRIDADAPAPRGE